MKKYLIYKFSKNKANVKLSWGEPNQKKLSPERRKEIAIKAV